MDNGTFSIYFLKPTNGVPEQNQVGRFMIQGGQFTVLEDPFHIFKHNLPDAKMDETHLKLLSHLQNSGYYKLVNDDDINEGFHEDLTPDLDLGATPRPDNEYVVSGPTLRTPMRLEVFGSNFVLDGRKLSEEEVKEFMDNVHKN